jgi:hypothetical protein
MVTVEPLVLVGMKDRRAMMVQPDLLVLLVLLVLMVNKVVLDDKVIQEQPVL